MSQQLPLTVPFSLIENLEQLKIVAQEWQKETILGVDIECENNLHHYGVYISIIQISSQTKNWIVDVLSCKTIEPVKDMLENPQITKIFHDVDFDFRMLANQFFIHPVNIFDTSVAAKLLSKTQLGLRALLENYFHVVKEERFQKEDWSLRPLNPDMISYAVKDTAYLIELKKKLEQELLQLNRATWFKQHMQSIAEKKYTMPTQSFNDVKGASLLTDSQRGALKALYELRDLFARKLDKPSHFIIGTKKMLELVCTPQSVEKIASIHGVHPIIKKRASQVFQAINTGSHNPIRVEKENRKRLSQEQKDLLEKITLLRDAIAVDMHLNPYLIATRDDLIQFCVTNSFAHLHDWQRELLESKIRSDPSIKN